MRILLSRLRQADKVYPDIASQLGCPLDQDPGAELKTLYVRLLVGFDLVAKGDTYPGYAMVFNEDLGPCEDDLISGNSQRLIESAKGSHHYWRTAVISAMSAARRRHVVLKSRIEWIGSIDPLLSMAMNQFGLRAYPLDCAALALHWQVEQEAGMAIETFPQEYFDSLRGDSLEDTAQRFGKTGT